MVATGSARAEAEEPAGQGADERPRSAVYDDEIEGLPPTQTRVGPPRRSFVAGERRFWQRFAAFVTPADYETLADYCRTSYRVAWTNDRLYAAWRRKTVDAKLVKSLDRQLPLDPALNHGDRRPARGRTEILRSCRLTLTRLRSRTPC